MAAKFNFSFALFDPTFSDCTLRLHLTGTPPRRRSGKKPESSSHDEAPKASQDPLRAAGQEDLEPCHRDGQGNTWDGDADCLPGDAAARVSQNRERSAVAEASELTRERSSESRPQAASEAPGAAPELRRHRTGEHAASEDPLVPALQPSGIESPEIWRENCERWESTGNGSLGNSQEAAARGPLHGPEHSQECAESLREREDGFVAGEDGEAGSSSSEGEPLAAEPEAGEPCSPLHPASLQGKATADDGTTQDRSRQSPKRRRNATPRDKPASEEAAGSEEGATFEEAPGLGMRDGLCKRSESGSSRDIPVSSVILAAKSAFFRELFAGTAAQSLVPLEIPHSDEPFFLELLSFFYTGTLSCTLRLSFANVLKLLVVAHRFGAEECVEQCVEVLGPFMGGLVPDQASLLVDLPGAVQGRELLWPLLRSAKAAILKHYTPLLKAAPGSRSVLAMSEGTLLALLQSGELDVGSEDVVARAALAWVRHRFPSRRARQDAIRTLVVPNIRLASLSPRFLESLQRLKEFHPRDLQQQLFDALIQAATRAAESRVSQAESTPPEPAEGPEKGREETETADAQRKQKLVLQASPLVNRAARNGGSGGETTGGKLPVGSSSSPAEPVPKENVHIAGFGSYRLGYQPPSGTLFLGLVIKRAALWTPGSGFCLLSPTTIVWGRRIIFGAKVEKHGRQATLGLYLVAVVGPKESFRCRFKFSCRPVGSTGDFQPLCAQAVPGSFSPRSPQWGLKDALGRSWCKFLREARESGVQEFEFRADIWMQT